MSLPKKFTIPENRIPKPWSQGTYDCCVAAAITKILEVFEYEKTGVYKMLSKGYMYGMNNNPAKKSGGMSYDYVLPKLLERGTVPEEMCPIMDEYPSIRDRITSTYDLARLNDEAVKTRIKSYTQIPGNAKFGQTVKQYLYDYQMPMLGDIVGKSHAVVIVGWDGDEFIYQDHKGKSTLYTKNMNIAYYLEGYLDKVDPKPEPKDTEPMEPIDLPEPTEIPDILAVLGSAEIITNYTLWQKKCTDDINIYWLCRKMAKYVIERGEWL